MAVVLGGGISGLSAAYYLKRSLRSSPQNKLVIVEALQKCGGWIRSNRCNDYVFEAGPKSLRPTRNTLRLVQDLDIANLIVPVSQEQDGRSMIYVNGDLHQWSLNVTGLFKKNKPFTKAPITALLHDLFTAPLESYNDDESLYEFVHRRFGREVAEYGLTPIICGIYAGDAREISVKFLMKTPSEYEKNYGGVVKGYLRSMFKNKQKQKQKHEPSYVYDASVINRWASYSFEGGMQVLPDTLLSKVVDEQCTLYSGVGAVQLKLNSEERKSYIKLSNGEELVTSDLFSSLPSFELAKLIEDDHPELANLLKEIPFVTVAIVNLKYDESNLLNKKVSGFAVHPGENLPILGVSFDSCLFPEQNSGTVLTVTMGGRWFDERCGKNPTETELLKLALISIENILGICDEPNDYKVNILKDCMPQYTVGHYSRVEKIRNYIDDKNLPLTVFGSSFDGIGVNDVILSARNVVECT